MKKLSAIACVSLLILGFNITLGLFVPFSAFAQEQRSEQEKKQLEERIQGLIEDLEDSDLEVRFSAADALGRLGADAKAAVPALAEALKDSDSGVRRNAAYALGEIGKPAVPYLIEALKDSDLEVRLSAAYTLVEMGKSAVPYLIEELKNSDSNVRWWAAQALGEIGVDAKAAVPALAETLKDSEWVVRWRAADALRKIGVHAKAAVPALIEALEDSVYEVFSSATAALGEMGKSAVPYLIEALKNSDSVVRSRAAFALGEIGVDAKAAVSALIEAKKDSNPGVHLYAVVALGKITSQKMSKKKAQQVLSDTRAILHEFYDGLSAHGEKAIVPMSHTEWFQEKFRRLERQTPDLQKAFEVIEDAHRFFEESLVNLKDIDDLVAIIPPDILYLIIENARTDNYWEPKQIAWRALTGRHDSESLSFIKKALKHPDRHFREHAANALAGRQDPESLPDIEKALDDDDYEVRRAAAGALEKRRDPESLELIEDALDSEWGYIRLAAVKALSGRKDSKSLKLIEESLDDDDYEVRRAAASALKGRQDDESLELIEKVLKDDDFAIIRSAAASALKGRQGSKPLKLIEEALDDDYYEVRKAAASALAGRQDSKSLELIEEALDDDVADVRKAAAGALEKRRDPESLELIEDALDSEWVYIRIAAIRSLLGRKDSISLKLVEKELTKDDSYYLFHLVIKALQGRKRSGALLNFIEEVLTHPWSSAEDRVDAVNVLGGWKESKSWDLLLLEKALKDPKDKVRQAASSVLLERANAKSLALRRRVLNEKEDDKAENDSEMNRNTEAQELTQKLHSSIIKQFLNLTGCISIVSYDEQDQREGFSYQDFQDYVECIWKNAPLFLVHDHPQLIQYLMADIAKGNTKNLLVKKLLDAYPEGDPRKRHSTLDTLRRLGVGFLGVYGDSNGRSLFLNDWIRVGTLNLLTSLPVARFLISEDPYLTNLAWWSWAHIDLPFALPRIWDLLIGKEIELPGLGEDGAKHTLQSLHLSQKNLEDLFLWAPQKNWSLWLEENERETFYLVCKLYQNPIRSPRPMEDLHKEIENFLTALESKSTINREGLLYLETCFKNRLEKELVYFKPDRENGESPVRVYHKTLKNILRLKALYRNLQIKETSVQEENWEGSIREDLRTLLFGNNINFPLLTGLLQSDLELTDETSELREFSRDVPFNPMKDKFLKQELLKTFFQIYSERIYRKVIWDELNNVQDHLQRKLDLGEIKNSMLEGKYQTLLSAILELRKNAASLKGRIEYEDQRFSFDPFHFEGEITRPHGTNSTPGANFVAIEQTIMTRLRENASKRSGEKNKELLAYSVEDDFRLLVAPLDDPSGLVFGDLKLNFFLWAKDDESLFQNTLTIEEQKNLIRKVLKQMFGLYSNELHDSMRKGLQQGAKELSATIEGLKNTIEHGSQIERGRQILTTLEEILK